MPTKPVFTAKINKASLKKMAGEKYFERGLDYFKSGAVIYLRVGDDGIAARVQGTESLPYTVRFWLKQQELQWGCTCPLGIEGAFCKHIVATGLAWIAGDIIEDEPDIGEELQEIQAFLTTLDKQALVDLLSRQAVWDENLFEEVRLAMRVMTDKLNKNK
ncbi:MAG: hypothetical protein K2X06_09845 [Burkholderiales bacterium]|nr:hypothetical protein [Burkholderiales bacterium]